MANWRVGWSDEDLLQSLNDYSGSAYNQDASEPARFWHSAIKIIKKRKQISPSTLVESPTVFIMAPLPDDITDAEQQPAFDRGRIEIAGKAWFGSKGLASAAALPIPLGSDADLFDCVVNKWHRGDAPALYFHGIDQEARIYPKGMMHPAECEIVSLDGTHLTLDTIHRIMDAMHVELLETPSASDLQRSLWANKSKWWPVNESEKGIQGILHVALKSHTLFTPLKVDQEHSSRMGRCDFILKEQDAADPTSWVHHAILELKVVKSFTHTGSPVGESTNIKAVSDGLDQARDYRVAHSCRLAALCCYDMRKKPDPAGAIAHEASRAEEDELGLWSWPIYNTVKALRTQNRHRSKKAKQKASKTS